MVVPTATVIPGQKSAPKTRAVIEGRLSSHLREPVSGEFGSGEVYASSSPLLTDKSSAYLVAIMLGRINDAPAKRKLNLRLSSDNVTPATHHSYTLREAFCLYDSPALHLSRDLQGP
jgi:hypothetical protein